MFCELLMLDTWEIYTNKIHNGSKVSLQFHFKILAEKLGEWYFEENTVCACTAVCVYHIHKGLPRIFYDLSEVIFSKVSFNMEKRDFMVISNPACSQGSMKNKPEAEPIFCAISLWQVSRKSICLLFSAHWNAAFKLFNYHSIENSTGVLIQFLKYINM